MITNTATNRRAFIRTVGLASLSVAATIVFPLGSTAGAAPQPNVDSDRIPALARHALLAWPGSGPSSDASHYEEQRDSVASAVASRLGLDATAMRQAWSAADIPHQHAILTGLTQLGVPYRRNTSKAGEGFDCSGLTTYAWAGAGLTLTRQSSAQIREAAPRTLEIAQAGDLMQYPGHVMIWLGVDRAVLQSPYPGSTVEIVLYREGRRVNIGDPTG